MTSTSGQYATAVNDSDGLSLPSSQDQELILDAWREVLAEVLHTRDTEWKEQLRVIKAESMAAVAELRAAAAEFRSTMEAMIAERLAQIRQPGDGKEGPRGECGQKGEKGDPGELPMARAWVDGEISYAGDVVTGDGGTWQAKKATAQKPPHADWTPLALPGRDAVTPAVRGTYRDGEAYRQLDIVALNGSAFIARHDNPGPCPGDGWQLIASAGRVGKPGIRGEKGEKGDKGERGENGQRGATVLGCKIDRESYTLTLIMSDSSEVPLQVRGLFEQYHEECGA
jgi:hypothetical protein